MTDPYSNQKISLPLLANEKCIGPSVLDLITIETDKKSAKEFWQLIDPDLLFEKPTKRKTGIRADKDKTVETEVHPFKTNFCTGGIEIEKEEGFIKVVKKTTVSINALVFRLAIGMTGSEEQATHYISSIASKAWDKDLERAFALYQLIKEKKRVDNEYLPDNLRAISSVSQIVESEVLRDACNWLGVDPDLQFNRRVGRPSNTENNDVPDSMAGEIIELTLSSDDNVIGKFIRAYKQWQKGLSLSTLKVTVLAELLVLFREEELNTDAQLLEAYLDSAEPDWRDIIADQSGAHEINIASDHWKILGLTPGSPRADIKKAYRRIMQVVHFDKNPHMPNYFAQTVNEAQRKCLEEISDD